MEKLLISIIRLRQKENYSQSYMAFRMRISQKQYSYIEAGKTKLKFADLLLICKILDTNPCDLLENSEILKELKQSSKDLIIEKLSETIGELKIKIKYIELINSRLLK